MRDVDIPLPRILSARRGNQRSLTSILQELLPDIRGAVTSRFHQNEIDDITQEMLVRVTYCIEHYDPDKGSFRAYAMTTVYRHLPAFKRIIPFPGLERAPEPHAKEEENTEMEVQELLSMLTPIQRTVVKDRFWNERSYQRIASARGMTEKEVSAHLQEALEQMRKGA